MGAKKKVDCGVWVEDVVSDFAGTVTAITHNINGTTQCKVESITRKEGGGVIEEWFDVRRLMPTDKDPLVLGSMPKINRGNGAGFCPQ